MFDFSYTSLKGYPGQRAIITHTRQMQILILMNGFW